MKKLLSISVIAALAVLPMAANATPIYDVTSTDPGATNASGPEAANAPKYSLAAAGANDDSHMATAGYVKGAYNAAIKAVNKVATTAANAADQDLSNLSATGTGVITTAVTTNAASGAFTSTAGLTSTTLWTAIDEVAGTAGNAADKNLSNLSATGKSNVSAQGTVDLTKNDYGTGTVGKALVDITTTADSAADQDLSNLSATGTGVITTAITNNAAGATYSNTTSGLTATTLQGAIDELADNAGDYATQDGVENTIETATITANVPTLTTWGNDSSTGTVAIQNVNISASYAEPLP